MDTAVATDASAALRPALPLPELRRLVREGRQSLIDQFQRGRASAPAASRLVRLLAEHIDDVLAQLWDQSGLPKGAALVAVGGYGRGELFPSSDVDVLLLLPQELAEGGDGQDSAAERERVAAFITACWDIGLEIGSSVRTVDECVGEALADVTTQTAML
ncbi:MAG: hypothetical protein RLZZ524_1465, partial [Pseudomonadota bacterium]